MRALVGSITLVSLVACGGAQEPLMPASGNADGRERSIAALTTARCDHEVGCARVGANRRYETRNDCEIVANADGHEAIGPARCAGGIDYDALSSCLDAVHTARCGASIERLDHFAACRTVQLCRD